MLLKSAHNLRSGDRSTYLTQRHCLQGAGLQYTAQPAHDSDSEGSELEGGYSDDDWLEDEVQVEDEEVGTPTRDMLCIRHRACCLTQVYK